MNEREVEVRKPGCTCSLMAERGDLGCPDHGSKVARNPFPDGMAVPIEAVSVRPNWLPRQR